MAARRWWAPILLLLVAPSLGPPTLAQDEEESLLSSLDDLLDELVEDPTLDGRIRFYYTATYRGRYHEFGDFDFPFPGSVSPDDRAWARELRRRHRNADDHDLDQYFSLSWRDFVTPEEESWWQTVDLNVASRWFQDLDGSPGGEASLGTFDTFGGNGQIRLQSLNARAELFDRHLELRAGRQQLFEAEWLHFDGAHARFRGLTFFGREVELNAFGGARVRFFRRSSSEHVGLGGAAMKLWPWEGARLRLSTVYFHDNTFEAEFRQRFDNGFAALTYRQINEDPQSLWLDVHLESPDHELTLDVGYRGKLGDDADDFDFDFTRSRRRDPTGTRFLFFTDLAPYDELTAELRKGFLEYWGAFGGGTVHQLRDRDSRDEWNTDWQEAWLGLDVSHAPWKGFTARVTARYLHTDLRRRGLLVDPSVIIGNGIPDPGSPVIAGDGEPDYLGVDLLLEQDFARIVAAGVIFVFRGYDYESNYALLENLTASSATVFVRWQATERTSWRLSYSYDRDFEKIYPDLDALHSLRLQFTFRL